MSGTRQRFRRPSRLCRQKESMHEHAHIRHMAMRVHEQFAEQLLRAHKCNRRAHSTRDRVRRRIISGPYRGRSTSHSDVALSIVGGIPGVADVPIPIQVAIHHVRHILGIPWAPVVRAVGLGGTRSQPRAGRAGGPWRRPRRPRAVRGAAPFRGGPSRGTSRPTRSSSCTIRHTPRRRRTRAGMITPKG
jgi:hypothetical protein